MIGEHCHPQETEKIDVREFREKVKQRVIYETTPIAGYYDGLINVMEYLDGLSFTVAKRKK